MTIDGKTIKEFCDIRKEMRGESYVFDDEEAEPLAIFLNIVEALAEFDARKKK